MFHARMAIRCAEDLMLMGTTWMRRMLGEGRVEFVNKLYWQATTESNCLNELVASAKTRHGERIAWCRMVILAVLQDN